MALFSGFLSIFRQYIQPQLIQEIFASPLFIVILTLLLNGHVRQMHLSIVNIRRVISVVRKPAETRPIEIYCQRVMRCYEYVDTHVELFVADQQRVVDVSLHYISLGLG